MKKTPIRASFIFGGGHGTDDCRIPCYYWIISIVQKPHPTIGSLFSDSDPLSLVLPAHPPSTIINAMVNVVIIVIKHFFISVGLLSVFIKIAEEYE